MSFAQPTHLTRDQIDAFEREVNAIRDSVMTTLGETSPEMWNAVWFCTFTILLFMGLLLAARIRLEEQRAALDELYLAAED